MRKSGVDENNRDGFITSVRDYLAEIDKLNKEFCGEDEKLMYRGEPVIYPTKGMPGIFREDFLKKDSHYELNILREMEANGYSEGKNLLELAIDAQHGGFPSRLLDVSYNCLVALYFAVVSMPERKKEENEKDGHVLVYKVEKAYCPTSENIVNNFERIINNPDDNLNSNVFSTNTKLVDHYKMNERIVAQQGAFILFPGKEWSPVSERKYREIKISHEHKGTIERELDDFFGINTNLIYPEIMNSISAIKEKAKYIVTNEFSLLNEIQLSFDNLKRDVEYELYRIGNLDNASDMVEDIMRLEKRISLRRDDYKLLLDRLNESEKDSEKIKEMVEEKYKQFLCSYIKSFSVFIKEGIKSCSDRLLWEEDIWDR